MVKIAIPFFAAHRKSLPRLEEIDGIGRIQRHPSKTFNLLLGSKWLLLYTVLAQMGFRSFSPRGEVRLNDLTDKNIHYLTREELLDECLRLQKKNSHLESVVSEYQSLAEQHQFTQFAVDHLEMGALWTTRDGKIIYVNDAMCRALGYTREEILELTVPDIDIGLSGAEWTVHWDAVKGQKQRSFETLHRAKDGRLIPVEIVSNHVEFYGVEFHCSFSRDISKELAARKLLDREHRFNQNLIEAAPVMIIVLDQEGRIVRANPRFEAVSGYVLEEAVDRYFLDDFFVPKDREWAGSLFLHSLREGQGETPILPMLTKSGEVRDVVWHGKSLRDESGASLGLLAIGQDVTEQQQMESRLRHSEKMEAIGLLAGGIAHDFNNQLGGILGYADILLEELGGDSRYADYLNSIALAVRRASDLTRQLLAFSRKGKYQQVTLDMNKIVLEVIDVLRHSIDKRIVIDHQLMSEPARLTGDPSQLQNAVLNLAINARDAMADGGRLLFSTASVVLDDTFIAHHTMEISPGRYIRLSVSDTGIGMDGGVLKQIFEPFFTTKKDQGTGMGLAAVYGTVTQHKGGITVFSGVGKGTEIALFFPHHSEATVHAKSELPPETVSSAENIRVLLAEDEKVLQEVAVEMLQRLGCTVAVCSDGAEAADFFAEHAGELDLVIMDMVMPKKNGKETFHEMRATNRNVPVVLASGYSADGDVRELLNAGAKAFVQKPYRARDLSLAISKAMRDEK